MIKLLKQHLGIPLAALLIGAAIFVLPKIIHDDYVFYKSFIHRTDK